MNNELERFDAVDPAKTLPLYRCPHCRCLLEKSVLFGESHTKESFRNTMETYKDYSEDELAEKDHRFTTCYFCAEKYNLLDAYEGKFDDSPNFKERAKASFAKYKPEDFKHGYICERCQYYRCSHMDKCEDGKLHKYIPAPPQDEPDYGFSNIVSKSLEEQLSRKAGGFQAPSATPFNTIQLSKEEEFYAKKLHRILAALKTLQSSNPAAYRDSAKQAKDLIQEIETSPDASYGNVRIGIIDLGSDPADLDGLP